MYSGSHIKLVSLSLLLFFFKQQKSVKTGIFLGLIVVNSTMSSHVLNLKDLNSYLKIYKQTF